MVNAYLAQRYCKEDISKIENCEAALADASQMFDCHHRTEIWWNCSKKELIENECYFNRKACELIFLTRSEHDRLHHKDKIVSEVTRQKLSASLKGKKFSEEHLRNWLKSRKGSHVSKATRSKLSEAFKGKSWKLVDGKRVWYSKEVE